MDWKYPEIREGEPTKYGWMVQHVDNFHLGYMTDIGAFTYINAKHSVIIKDFVQIGSHCSIYTISSIDGKEGIVLLKKNCKIGSHSTIMPGVTIGENAIVGAHSFVNSDVPDNAVAYGIPAAVQSGTEGSSEGVYKINELFEQELSRYTGAPYVALIDCQSNALFLALTYEGIAGKTITIPARTYPSVPCEIIHAGGKVKFSPVEGTTLKGAYRLEPTKVWDSALRFTPDMYIADSHMCISFTGPYKHLKLSKGGAILTDDYKAWLWFRRARFSGRRECSYHTDNLDMLGWNFLMTPETALRGLLMMRQFYDAQGNPKHNEDLDLPYPDLSKFPVYTEA
jgi:carbonic anhydrase/acetyltransferase-like protein (isoleucine patch superfamily)